MKKFDIRKYDEKDFKAFVNLTKSDLDILINSDNTDFNWIEVFEEYIPYLDNIIRNPRRFIQSEENLVPIEKAKKFTEESIKHLAQNTQLIQDIDNDGMPQPLKVLNVYKEETYDLYENRFIHSLVENLHYFLNNRLDKLKNMGATATSSGREINFKATSTINSDIYNAELKISLKESDNNVDLDVNSILEKVENMYAIVVGFKASTIMKELERAEPVRSPIRKTNAILKDTDLNKCLELWEKLEALLNDLELEKAAQNNSENDSNYIDGLNLTNYLNYCILTNKESSDKLDIELNPKEAFEQIIKQYIRRKEVTIDNFKDTIVKDFDSMCKKYIKQYDEVNRIYDLVLDEYEQNLNKDFY